MEAAKLHIAFHQLHMTDKPGPSAFHEISISPVEQHHENPEASYEVFDIRREDHEPGHDGHNVLYSVYGTHHDDQYD